MVILFVHQNFPGQDLHLAAALRERGERIVAIGAVPPRERSRALNSTATSDRQRVFTHPAMAGLSSSRRSACGLAVNLVVGHPSWRPRTQLRPRRAPQLITFHDLDWGLAPTRWQGSTALQESHEQISVIHEGIDPG